MEGAMNLYRTVLFAMAVAVLGGTLRLDPRMSQRGLQPKSHLFVGSSHNRQSAVRAKNQGSSQQRSASEGGTEAPSGHDVTVFARVGVLVIDIFNGQSKELIWRGHRTTICRIRRRRIFRISIRISTRCFEISRGKRLDDRPPGGEPALQAVAT